MVMMITGDHALTAGAVARDTNTELQFALLKRLSGNLMHGSCTPVDPGIGAAREKARHHGEAPGVPEGEGRVQRQVAEIESRGQGFWTDNCEALEATCVDGSVRDSWK